MVAWFVAGVICLLLLVAAGWVIVRLLELGPETDPAGVDAETSEAEFENEEDDSADSSWRSMADAD